MSILVVASCLLVIYFSIGMCIAFWIIISRMDELLNVKKYPLWIIIFCPLVFTLISGLTWAFFIDWKELKTKFVELLVIVKNALQVKEK